MPRQSVLIPTLVTLLLAASCNKQEIELPLNQPQNPTTYADKRQGNSTTEGEDAKFSPENEDKHTTILDVSEFPLISDLEKRLNQLSEKVIISERDFEELRDLANAAKIYHRSFSDVLSHYSLSFVSNFTYYVRENEEVNCFRLWHMLSPLRFKPETEISDSLKEKIEASEELLKLCDDAEATGHLTNLGYVIGYVSESSLASVRLYSLTNHIKDAADISSTQGFISFEKEQLQEPGQRARKAYDLLPTQLKQRLFIWVGKYASKGFTLSSISMSADFTQTVIQQLMRGSSQSYAFTVNGRSSDYFLLGKTLVEKYIRE